MFAPRVLKPVLLFVMELRGEYWRWASFWTHLCLFLPPPPPLTKLSTPNNSGVM